MKFTNFYISKNTPVKYPTKITKWPFWSFQMLKSPFFHQLDLFPFTSALSFIVSTRETCIQQLPSNPKEPPSRYTLAKIKIPIKGFG